jgi:hypothetical protein
MVASVYMTPRPSGSEVDAEATTTFNIPGEKEGAGDDDGSDTSTTSVVGPKPRHYYRNFADHYNHARENAKYISTKPRRPTTSLSRTFRYTGQLPAKATHHRTVYTRVVIASSVTEIKPGTFYNWSSVQEISFERPSRCEVIGSKAFYGCHNLTTLDSDVLPGESLRVIGPHAFACCASVQSVYIPEGVKVVQESTFFGCSNLTSLHLPTTLEEIQVRLFVAVKVSQQDSTGQVF